MSARREEALAQARTEGAGEPKLQKNGDLTVVCGGQLPITAQYEAASDCFSAHYKSGLPCNVPRVAVLAMLPLLPKGGA